MKTLKLRGARFPHSETEDSFVYDEISADLTGKRFTIKAKGQILVNKHTGEVIPTSRGGLNILKRGA